MKYSQQMFKYGEGRYRFISHEPLQKGDKVYLINGKGEYEVESVEESREDKGKWNVLINKIKVKVLTNIVKIKDDKE